MTPNSNEMIEYQKLKLECAMPEPLPMLMVIEYSPYPVDVAGDTASVKRKRPDEIFTKRKRQRLS